MVDVEREQNALCDACNEPTSHLVSPSGKRGLCMKCGNEVMLK